MYTLAASLYGSFIGCTLCAGVTTLLKGKITKETTAFPTKQSSIFIYLQCRDNIKNAFDKVDQLIAKKEWKTLERDFISCGDISNASDTWFFTQNLATILDGIVQYNAPIRELNIALVCQYMNTVSNTSYENLLHFIKVKKYYFYEMHFS